MKLICAAALLIAATSATADYYPALNYRVYGAPAEKLDKSKIDNTMAELWSAWSSQNASAVANTHTKDAEWTNAFGRTYRGSKELKDFLENRLFPNFDKKTSQQEAESFKPISRRYIGSNSAVITGRLESTRGSSVGTTNRKISFTFVLQKINEEWKISNQVITDLREKRNAK